MSRSSLPLRPDPPVSPAPPDFTSSAYTGGRARQLGLGCERHLPCFRSVLLPHVPLPLRREEKQVHIPDEALLPWPSSLKRVGSSNVPGIGFSRGLLSTLLAVFALLRPARSLVLLDRSELERHRSPAAEDFSLTRAFPRKGHPPRESDIATRRPGADYRDRTFTGWSTAVTGCTFWRRTSSARRDRAESSASDEDLDVTPAAQELHPGAVTAARDEQVHARVPNA